MKKSLLFGLCLSSLMLGDGFAVTARNAVSTGMKPVSSAGASARQRQSDFKTGPINLNSAPSKPSTPSTPSEPSVPSEPTPPAPPAPDPMLEEIARQRNICMSNNVGISNTFVWADRNSDVSNYSYMVENVENPANNACFVKVDMRSSDGRIDMSDVKSKYFIMGNDITCGQWVDEKMLEERILEATKKGRTWGTIASVVGGAGVGVAAMETFGNKLIGGKVMGQKALEGQELLRSQILAMKKSNKTEYDRIIAALDTLEAECASDVWNGDGVTKPADCDAATNLFIGLKAKLADNK